LNAPDEPRARDRDAAIDDLRAALVVMVVLLHAALAYCSFSTRDPANWFDSSAPVVDAARWPLLDWAVLYLDTFAMPLLFLISGLFALPSLRRKGPRAFLISRVLRLGIPFAFSALILAPLAFAPSFLMADPRPATPYLATFFTTDGWPVGPPWFLWVLLAFNGLLALVHAAWPDLPGRLRGQPTALVVLLVTAAAFLPAGLLVSHFYRASLGPFDVQPGRLGLYLASFVLGMALGSGERWRTPGWPRFWAAWLWAGLFAFLIYMGAMGNTFRLPGPVTRILLVVTFSFSCTGACLGWLGAARRLAGLRHRLLDSLIANAYGIYLVHYAVVVWIQFALLPVGRPPWFKFGAALAGGLGLSWGASALLRRIPAPGRVL